MATKQSQRIGIWVIAVALTVGTLGGFLVMVLAPKNQASDQARFEELQTEYQAEYATYQGKVEAQNNELAKKLSKEYYDTFKQYEKNPKKFNADDVKDLKKKDLKKGDGKKLTDESTFTAYYIGWNPKGKVFDSSFDKQSLKVPIEAAPGGVIEGWTKGVDGMKIGGVREVTIPADLAYGSQSQGDDIPADTPLKFIIMVIPTPDKGDAIAAPKMSEELKQLYARLNGIDPRLLEDM